MATFRVVWELFSNNGSTFNEVYYVDGSTPKAAATPDDSLVQARLALMHPLYTLSKVRSAQVDANRVVGLTSYNLKGTAAITGSGDDGPSAAGDAIICILTANPGGSRRIWLRGAPDRYMVRDPDSGADVVITSLKNRLTTWFAALETAKYGLRTLKPQAPGPLQNAKILSVDGSAKKGYSILTFTQAPGYAYPGRIIIGGASKKDLPALNGRWSLMKAPDGVTIQIPYQTPQGSVVDGGNAHSRSEQYNTTSVFTAASCGFANFGTRTTKNAITHSRGARRAVRIRTSL